MGQVVNFNNWKKSKGKKVTLEDDNEFDLIPCPTCKAPVLKEGDGYAYSEEALLDFLYEETGEFLEEVEENADEIGLKLDKISRKISKNEIKLSDVESKVEDLLPAC